MMALRQVSLGDVAAGAAGSWIGIGDLKDCYAYVAGTFTGTWILAVSYDGGTTSVTFDTGTAVKNIGALPRCGHVKLSLGSGSGTIKGRLAGNDPNLGA